MARANAVSAADGVRRVRLCQQDLAELGASVIGAARASAVLLDPAGVVCGRAVRMPDPCSSAWSSMSWHVSLGGPSCGLAWCCVASTGAADTLHEAVLLAVSAMRERAAQFERAADAFGRLCRA